MKHTKQTYVYGTAAKKIQYDVYEENRVLKEKRLRKRNNKAKVRTVLSILVAFVLGAVVVYRYALITEQNYNLSKLTKNYESLKNENLRYLVDIEKDTDLANIKEIAESRLGMQNPDKYQIVHMKVPKSDYTRVSDTYMNAQKQKNGIIASLVDKLNQMTGFLY
ncbi:MAG: cell division protein FtsL [Clostridia bacterium]|nr:cell division protein FtsL [Clostridia bacterium]